ncbi:MAG: IS66 family insertion sequence element accessory protein TnpB [Alicyclobacillus macrosporangiidus]|uniref:IS66 family insertion sequence element accessory protein TnpB n=1 Tax=Alicyclobacillus macrosporangiidus TaxID=392015 RepID=UPI0034E94A57|nr:IS66 family insertion sequence element accessory protein TnpB [Alicyclobacillus macrosporangiidus]
MLNEAVHEQRVYLACDATDMRKSIDGLAALVQEHFNLNPFSPFFRPITNGYILLQL